MHYESPLLMYGVPCHKATLIYTLDVNLEGFEGEWPVQIIIQVPQIFKE